MSIVYDVEGIVIGERAKLEKIAEQYLNDPEAKELNCTLEAKINDDGNLEFKGQGVGRNWEAPAVEKFIEKYLDDDLECYKLWGSTDGCWDQYTNDTEGRFYKQWYVNDYTHGTPKVFFDDYDEAKTYAMQIIRNNPEYIVGLESSGMDETDYFDEMFLQYLELNQEPVKIVQTVRARGDVVNTDAMNEDIPDTEKGNYRGKFLNLVIPECFTDKKITVENFWVNNLSYVDDNTAMCCISDSSGYMDWYPGLSGYLVRFVEEEDFVIENGKSIGMIFEELEDANAKLSEIGQHKASSMVIDENDAESLFNMGNNYFFGNGVEIDLNLSAEYYKKSAEQGHSGAQNNLGNAYNNGNGVQQDYKLAAEWYEKSANQGNAYAQNSLGYLYFEGLGVQQDYNQAAILFKKSAEQNFACAQSNLAECYENGYGVEKDLVLAVKWYKKSAEQGFETAINWLNSNPDTVEKAKQSEFEAELRENTEAFFTAAKQLFNEGNPANDADCKEAYELFYDAAQSNHAEAMTYIGVMYRHGFFVEKDDAKAAEWYQKAIDTGGDTLLSSMAYNNLGILYYNGQGVERNLQKAKELFELAVAKDNNERAKQHLDEVNRELSSNI